MNKVTALTTKMGLVSKKAILSLAVATTMVFSVANQASAQVSDVPSFLMREGETISFFAHPTASYIGSEYEGNGVVAIYYEGFTGTHILRVRGKVNGYGVFSDLTVLSDTSSVPPFMMVTLLRKGLAAYASQEAKNTTKDVSAFILKHTQQALQSGDGETMCETTLMIASL